ncbi:MAG: pilus assembly protein TadG-related protein [Rhodospirillales bacterium]
MRKGVKPSFSKKWLHRRRPLSELAGDGKGAFVIIFALMLPLLIWSIGVGVEVGNWYANLRNLQGAADAAAVAGVYEVWDASSISDSQTELLPRATAEAERNGLNASASDTITLNYYDEIAAGDYSTDYSTDNGAVEVILSQAVDLYFAGWFMDTSTVTVNAQAVATLGTSSEACVLTLGTSGTGFSASGNSTVDLSGCSIAVNSTDSDDAMQTSGGSTTVNTDCYSVVGGTDFQDPDNVTTSCSSASTGAHAATDPYADTVQPVESDYTSRCTSVPTCNAAVNTGSLEEGVYSQLTLQGTVDLAGGVYYIKGGNLKVNANAVITNNDGLGVTFFLTNDGSNWPTVTISGGAQMTLSAPDDDTNPYYGLLFYQDQDTPPTQAITLNGGADTNFTGALYFPSGDVSVSGNSSMDSTCIQIISYTVSFSGDTDMDNDCDMLSSGSGNSIDIEEVTLVE